jgi:pilus assembly protein Flp/PilA
VRCDRAPNASNGTRFRRARHRQKPIHGKSWIPLISSSTQPQHRDGDRRLSSEVSTPYAVNESLRTKQVSSVASSVVVPFNGPLECIPQKCGRCITNGSKALKRVFLKFLGDQTGATAIEYGLIAAGISLAIIAAVNGLGTNLNGVFSSVNSSLK